MQILIALTSIFLITLLAWIIARTLKWKLCPICIGVCSTWIWLLGAKFLNIEIFSQPIDPLIPAILMGGSVVGIAYQIEKRLSEKTSPLFWKVLFMPAGFTLVYGIFQEWWIIVSVIAAFLIFVSMLFLMTGKKENENESRIEGLKEKMKKCC